MADSVRADIMNAVAQHKQQEQGTWLRDFLMNMEDQKRQNSQPAGNMTLGGMPQAPPRDQATMQSAIDAFIAADLPVSQLTPFVDDYYAKAMLDR